MDHWWRLVIDLGIVLVLIAGIAQFRSPGGARSGNLTAAFALLCAFAVVLFRNPIVDPSVVIPVLVIGALAGWVVAMWINMIQIPAMVAFQNGAGGLAALLVASIELTRDPVPSATVAKVAGLLCLVVGAATFSGSMVASGKLAALLRQQPVVLTGHNKILAGLTLAAVVLGIVLSGAAGSAVLPGLLALIGLSLLLGIVFSIRVGGADMPVLISSLNAASGLAAALCGIVLRSQMLIVCGATVAASGSILTHAMCKAMNRKLLMVFVGIETGPTAVCLEATGDAPTPVAPAQPRRAESTEEETPLRRALAAIDSAQAVIIIPGFGMAQAHAQFETVRLAEKVVGLGKQVKFAIHPIAGRMPGHMHVLLAEAEVDPDMLFDMDEINHEFGRTDLAVIVGASDVVNPAAANTEGTPISGMPILAAREAKQILVCNLDEKPGYSGVENSLYAYPKSILMFGDAKATLSELLKALD